MRHAVRLSVLLALCGAAAAQSDTITWTDGTQTTNVTVTAFNLREVTFKSRGVEESRSADRVAELDVAKIKDVFRRAYGAPRTERVGQFLRIAEEKVSDPFVAQFGYMEAARMLIENDQYGDAFGVFEELSEKCPDSGFLPEQYRAKLDYYIAREQKGDVAAVASKYSTAAQTQGYPAGYALEANFYNGLARALNGELSTQQLRQEMESIVKSADPNYPVVASRARLQIANSLRLENKHDEAKTDYLELIDDPKSAPQVRASAWLGLGHAYAAKGNPADKEPYRDALLAFLRVYLDDDASPAQKAESLHFGALAAEKWGGEGASRYYKVLRGRLASQYPDSPWNDR